MLKRKSINYHIQVAKESLKNYNRVLKNDFVLHLSTYESGLAYSKEIGITSPAYDVLRFFDKNNNDPIFFKYVFSNKKFINSLVPFTYGLRQGKSINLEELNKSLIEKTNISEQQKIGKLLENIDNLITLEEIKLNKLKQLKQTLLQKMFPEYNSKIPRIRFKGFNEEWKEEKVGSFSEITIGEFVIKTKQNDFYEYPVYNGGITNTGFYKEYNNEGNKIIVSARGANAGYINFSEKRYWAGNSCYSIDLISKRHSNIKFIFYSMLINKYKFDDNKQVGTIPSVSLEDVKNFVIYLTSYSEQQKIGDFFCKIDTLINLYNSKLNKLRQIKESLLQKMFV
ncbi:restriction endonuclease subunit S [Mycoplasmopsis felis]|uniref:restriction endonuclease subunit S n=1 Tax=Mycoplasmopsis felis TaxID=33923 RepID=UPI002AF6B220|nr:restriction endonuclease subunit S [Mycoplasmopsis felis]WQQ02225.1 restriction endonuclease subunit S [Mycoplasmopsis felis]